MRRALVPLHLRGPKIRSFSSSTSQIPSQSTTNSFLHHPLASILHRHGFRRSDLQDLLSHHQFPTAISPSDLLESVKILSSLELRRESLVSLVSSSPRILEPGFLRKWQVCFSRLGFGPSNILIRSILKHSSWSMVDPHQSASNLQDLRDAGFGSETLLRVLEEVPGIMRNIDGVIGRMRALEAFGFLPMHIDRICRLFPRFLLFGENRVVPLLAEFRNLGFVEEAKKAVVENPSLVLGMEVGELSRCVELLDSLKCREPVRERILAKGRFSAAVAVKSRVDCLCRHGLIRRDALVILMREPRVILYAVGEIEQKIEFLCHRMGFSIDWLAEVPEFLGVNLEKQIVPRYRVIEYLRSRGALDLVVDPRQYVKFSRKRFYNMFVKPYPDCEVMFGGIVRDVEVKAKLTAGLWKLFKPSVHPQSKADVSNMKSFMKS